MSQFIQSSITLVCRLLTKEDGPPPSNVTYFEGEITARNEESAFGMPTVSLKTKLTNQDGGTLVDATLDVESLFRDIGKSFPPPPSGAEGMSADSEPPSTSTDATAPVS